MDVTLAADDQSATYASTARAIVRCTRKGCRTAHRLDFTTTRTIRAFNGRMAESRSVLLPGHEFGSFYRDRYDLARMLTQGFTCTACGGNSATFDVIKGSFSEAVKCGPRCRSAVGPSCDCQCGGENHASNHTAL